MASWTGDHAGTVDGLYYRGWRNLNAILNDLVANHQLGAATTILAGGDSAGGLAIYLHIDHISSLVHAAGIKALILGMPDSGYWPDLEGNVGFRGSQFRDMLTLHNSTGRLPQTCQAMNPTNLSRCVFPQYFAQTIQTPLFALQSLVDPLQVKDDSQKQAHAGWLLSSMRTTVLSRKTNGAWLHMCERHCGAELLTIDGVTAPGAVTTFLTARRHLRRCGCRTHSNIPSRVLLAATTDWAQTQMAPLLRSPSRRCLATDDA